MIRKFSIKLFFHTILLGFSIILVTIVPLFILEKNATFILPDDVNLLVLGHSHSECAFDDKFIGNFRNLSNAGQSYFYLLPKLEKVLEQNPQVEKVFIEFSNGQIEERMNDWIWGYDKLSNFFPTYAPFLGWEDNMMLYQNNRNGLYSTIPIMAKKNLGKVLLGDFNYSDDIGKFKPLEKSIIDSLLNNRKNGTKEPEVTNPVISEINLQYLKKMILKCETFGVEVILIRSPQHRFYNYRANEGLFQKIRRERFNDIEFLDFNDFPLSDEEFGDFAHVNKKGAIIFSNWFDEALIKNDFTF